MTQAEIILQSLKSVGKDGLHPQHFIENLHIYQYNARIHELREAFGCTHKHSNSCAAKQHILNKTLDNGTTLFIYRNDEDDTRERMKMYMAQHLEDTKNEPSQEQGRLF